ncbi:MAG: hemolysin family protein [Intrasporangium sp.]|uniref:hemolysin family protein n=1 Tax=Intrasporangium sp. TaxID=1925024 RepID=UPI00264992C6|nr:hemolysin family protein [Intrasporangium sp.]MDN5794301.1 hemolysin family protein [Intrasporangium sp.]
MGLVLGIVLVLGLTAGTGYFVAQEFAYVAVDRAALRELARSGDAAAERALRVTSRLSFALSAAQFGITVTALLVGYVSEPLIGVGLAELLGFTGLTYAARLGLSVTAVLVFSTVVQMVFGELAPKNLAIAQTVAVARALSRSTLAYLAVVGPVVRLFDSASTRLLRAVGIEPVEELDHSATAEDLTSIIDESHAGGLLADELSGTLERGLRLHRLTADDALTPRVRTVTIGAQATVSDLVALLDSGHSRFPVTGRDRDDIVGVAGLAEVLSVPSCERPSTRVRDVASPASLVPESAPLAHVLDQLRREHRQLAVVIDEHGGFAGVISLEDIAEEVVGDIFDEEDEPDTGVLADGLGAWLIPARLRLDELVASTALLLDSEDPFETVSGLVLDRLGRTPVIGDVVEVTATSEQPIEVGAPGGTVRRVTARGARLVVTAVDRHVAQVVRLEALDTPPTSPHPTAVDEAEGEPR